MGIGFQDLFQMIFKAPHLNIVSSLVVCQITSLISNSLQTVNLSHNMMTGTIPSQLSKLTHLNYLIIERNKFAGEFPNELKKLTSLSKLMLLKQFLPCTHTLHDVRLSTNAR